MDGLSVAASMNATETSINATLSQLNTTVSLLNDMQNKPEDVRRLLLELSSISGLMQSLRLVGEKRQVEADWRKLWLPLLSPGGPISELQRALATLTRTLSSARDLGLAKRSWKRAFGRNEIQGLRAMTQNASTVIALALTVDGL